MNETYFVLFVIGLALVAWILQSVSKEGMETCSRPLMGPKDTEYPEVYGPTGPGSRQTAQNGGGTTSSSKQPGGTATPTQTERSGECPATGQRVSEDGYVRTESGMISKGSQSGAPLRDDTGLYPAWNDDVMDSTTMTQNPLYASTFQFQIPSYKMDLTFPSEGPPQPYLTDFSKFHR
jgi:hypothetical protein